MLKKVIVLVSITLMLVSSTLSWGKEEAALKIGDQAPDFTLKDADDKEYSLKLVIEKETVKAIVLIMGDRKVRKEGNKWAIELGKIYGKNKEIAMLMVADLRDLPFFVTEGMVKWGTKRENLPIPILLDWEGKVNIAYKTQKGKPDLFIIGSGGKVSYHYVGVYSDKMIEEVKTKVQDTLKGVPSGKKEDECIQKEGSKEKEGE